MARHSVSPDEGLWQMESLMRSWIGDHPGQSTKSLHGGEERDRGTLRILHHLRQLLVKSTIRHPKALSSTAVPVWGK